MLLDYNFIFIYPYRYQQIPDKCIREAALLNIGIHSWH
jgi:hypothetical protein